MVNGDSVEVEDPRTFLKCTRYARKKMIRLLIGVMILENRRCSKEIFATSPIADSVRLLCWIFKNQMTFIPDWTSLRKWRQCPVFHATSRTEFVDCREAMNKVRRQKAVVIVDRFSVIAQGARNLLLLTWETAIHCFFLSRKRRLWQGKTRERSNRTTD